MEKLRQSETDDPSDYTVQVPTAAAAPDKPAPAIAFPPPGRVAILSIPPGMPQGVITSLDKTDKSERILLLNCLQGQDDKMESLIGHEIKVEHIVIHAVDMESPQTGEVKTISRVVLVTPEKQRISSASDGVVGSLRNFVAVFGPPPWKPPIACRPVEQKSRGGFRYYILEAVG